MLQQIESTSKMSSDDEKLSVQTSEDFMTDYREWYRKHFNEEFKIPKFNRKEFDVKGLWDVVMGYGGSLQVCREKAWAKIGREFNPPSTMTNLSFHIKRMYERYLLPYEQVKFPEGAMMWRNPQVQNIQVKRPALDPLGQPVWKKSYAPQSSLDNWQLVGRVIKLWLHQQDTYAQAVVQAFHQDTGMHRIRYSNGYFEMVDLQQEEWYLDDQHSDGKLAKNIDQAPYQLPPPALQLPENLTNTLQSSSSVEETLRAQVEKLQNELFESKQKLEQGEAIQKELRTCLLILLQEILKGSSPNLYRQFQQILQTDFNSQNGNQAER
eukprot:TRINITY_DN2736_c0_g2_i6.p1 TRINITY_DN2736_c0_g2~~TRINITY_DN2736_c0_g2_i6.p1  ORF type:complete len:323 (+),score=40.05 TRINITY_DN2736_c0_g2_i6:182-1150(+)